MLQNFCENLEYSKLLDEANQSPDSALRMAYVMAFAVSSYSSTINRVKKPFNPILGETFEL
jgi:oxysterol-binding protein 1